MSDNEPKPIECVTVDVKKLILSMIERERPLTTTKLLVVLLDKFGPSIGDVLKR